MKSIYNPDWNNVLMEGMLVTVTFLTCWVNFLCFNLMMNDYILYMLAVLKWTKYVINVWFWIFIFGKFWNNARSCLILFCFFYFIFSLFSVTVQKWFVFVFLGMFYHIVQLIFLFVFIEWWYIGYIWLWFTKPFDFYQYKITNHNCCTLVYYIVKHILQREIQAKQIQNAEWRWWKDNCKKKCLHCKQLRLQYNFFAFFLFFFKWWLLILLAVLKWHKLSRQITDLEYLFTLPLQHLW